MFSGDYDNNQTRSDKDELDALASEFMDAAPTCICHGCETHGCPPEGHFCAEDTQPAFLFPHPREPSSGGMGLAPVVSFEEDGGGSNEDVWEVATQPEAPMFMSELWQDNGGEG